MEKNLPSNVTKLCAVVCEYDPFHNGHLKQLSQIAALSGCNGILCLMSGNFTQRGEAAVLDKYSRAECAVRGGADVVAELPLPFAVANAETFAKGAVTLLSKIESVKYLAFGVECGKKEDFIALAKALNQEPPLFQAVMKDCLAQGLSFAAAKERAVAALFPTLDKRLYTRPNCVLGIEYTRAILRLHADIDIFPVLRTGAEHDQGEVTGEIASASAIRRALLEGNSPCAALPPYSQAALVNALTKQDFQKADSMQYYALVTSDKEFLKQVPDCTEGLENGLKSVAKEVFTAEEVVKRVTAKRYTSARIRRILLCNMLGITTKIQRSAFDGAYLKILAVKDKGVLSQLNGLPLVTRKEDEAALPSAAKEVFALTKQADEIYASLCHRTAKHFYTCFLQE